MENISVIIDRLVSSDKQINGSLYIINNHTLIFDCHTLELPDKNNEKRVSCIPKGTYKVMKRYSDKHKNHFQILDVPNRSFILIHSANYVYQLLGCIAVGKNKIDINGDGLDDVTESKTIMTKLYELLPDNFDLTIR